MAARTKKTAPAPDAAEALADYLMTNFYGQKADRLVLVKGPPGSGDGFPTHDLGGMCRDAVVKAIRKFFPTEKGRLD